MVFDVAQLAARAARLRALHTGQMLILPNVWDASSAGLVADAGFPAVATASAAISVSLGYQDGERAPWQEMFAAAARVARAVQVPVTVDAEAGYGLPSGELVDRLLESGASGCNIEDTDHPAGGLVGAERQASRIAEIRAAASDAGVPLVINARVDAWLPGSGVAADERLAETVRRSQLYRASGADCVYPIGLGARTDLVSLLEASPGPVNGNAGRELALRDLREIGVARVSYGPRFYFAALAAFEAALRELQAESDGNQAESDGN